MRVLVAAARKDQRPFAAGGVVGTMVDPPDSFFSPPHYLGRDGRPPVDDTRNRFQTDLSQGGDVVHRGSASAEIRPGQCQFPAPDSGASASLVLSSRQPWYKSTRHQIRFVVLLSHVVSRGWILWGGGKPLRVDA